MPRQQQDSSLADLTALAGLTEHYNQQTQAQQVLAQRQRESQVDALMKMLALQQGQQTAASEIAYRDRALGETSRHDQALELMQGRNFSDEAQYRQDALGVSREQMTNADRRAQALELLQQNQNKELNRHQQVTERIAGQSATDEASARNQALYLQEQGLQDARNSQAVKAWLDVYGEDLRAGKPVNIEALKQLPNGPQIAESYRKQGVQLEQDKLLQMVGPAYLQGRKDPRKLSEALDVLNSQLPETGAKREAWDTLPWDRLNQSLSGPRISGGGSEVLPQSMSDVPTAIALAQGKQRSDNLRYQIEQKRQQDAEDARRAFNSSQHPWKEAGDKFLDFLFY